LEGGFSEGRPTFLGKDRQKEPRFSTGLSRMVWKPTQFEKVPIKVLHENKAVGEMTCLLKLGPGASLPMHVHAELEQSYVLAGSITDHDGTAHAGDYVWRKAGSVHENRSDTGAARPGGLTQAQHSLDRLRGNGQEGLSCLSRVSCSSRTAPRLRCCRLG
jgi:quercetin dioxygenase-like cupin family protein